MLLLLLLMAAEGHNVDATLLAVGRDHGHYFVRKTFVCNFVCHDKCVKTVVSYCSGVALQLIKVHEFLTLDAVAYIYLHLGI
ncbi:unnamed protein product [Gongylonema pulchrum]|uniref:Secreted protein n=1 Tax=Gongylonema pulchrum TaxID=637853 RepID=A0A3P6QCZ0_9BILA|nr:unnamed protein product [Gongylonema pulchrum]